MDELGMDRAVSMDALDRHPMLDLLEASEDGHVDFQRGDLLNGTIAWIGENELLIDVGGKVEGLVQAQELNQMEPELRAALAVGDEVECVVITARDRQGNLVVSMSQARMGQDWELAEQYAEEGTVFESPVSGHNKGGLIVYVGQVRGFVPASQIDRRHGVDRSRIDGTGASPLASLVDQPLWFKVIEIDRRKNRLILSEQAAMRERRKQLKTDLLDRLDEGQVLSGVVTSLADFGAFVDVGGADGLIHLSEISWQRVSHPSEVLQLGQTVTVKVIAVDRDRKRIGLSLKQLEPEPWTDVEARYAVGSLVEGTITRLAEFGAFARLDEAIEGLIHVSELSDEGKRVEEVVQPGDQLTLRVIRVDADRKRIGLSLKRAVADYDSLGAGAEGMDDGADLEPEGMAAYPEAMLEAGDALPAALAPEAETESAALAEHPAEASAADAELQAPPMEASAAVDEADASADVAVAEAPAETSAQDDGTG